MPREPLKNVGRVCKDHAPKPGQFIGKDPITFVGRAVKLGFPAKAPNGTDTHEHMWVRVKETQADGALIGVLDNDPVLKCDYRCGDHVSFSVAEIEAVFSEN